MTEQMRTYIQTAITDGELEEKEIAFLRRKAVELGDDADEVEMTVKAEMAKFNNKSNKDKVYECPSCGDRINGLTSVCSSCGHIFSNTSGQAGESVNLHNAIKRIEELIIELKSYPKPTLGNLFKTIFFTYITCGLYLLFRKKTKITNFEEILAKCQKEKRSIKIYYGDDRKVQLLIEELESEIDGLSNERKKMKTRRSIIIISLLLFFIGFYAAFFIWAIKS